MKKSGKSKHKCSSSLSLVQPTLPTIANQKMPYDPQSTKQKSITKKLAIFVGTSNVPISLVENVEFQELLCKLDSRYQTPGRFKIAKELDMLYSNLKEDLRKSLDSAERISLCADIWSKKGMTASFLGLTAHYYSRSKKAKCNITIAVRRFESPHTAERVSKLVDEIVSEWKIPSNKIFRILTDNGSNMIAAFKGDIHMQSFNDQEFEDDDAIELDSNSSDSEDEDIEDEEKAVEVTTPEEPCIERALEDYDDHETQCDIAMTLYQRVSCFTHTLQLVVHMHDASPHIKSTISKAHKLVSKMNKSTKATEKLIKKSGKKLVNTCPTRWSSTFLMISRLLEVKVSLNSLCEELGRNAETLTNLQWRTLEMTEKLLNLLLSTRH